MKANELRLGNYIGDKDDIAIVESIDKEGCMVQFINDEKQGFRISEPINAIPLTEEWLLKFGFVLENGWFKKNRLLLFNINNNYFTTLSKEIVSVNITTVHQLQNLYFALTNEELTMK
jgi:hypothetical protein